MVLGYCEWRRGTPSKPEAIARAKGHLLRAMKLVTDAGLDQEARYVDLWELAGEVLKDGGDLDTAQECADHGLQLRADGDAFSLRLALQGSVEIAIARSAFDHALKQSLRLEELAKLDDANPKDRLLANSLVITSLIGLRRKKDAEALILALLEQARERDPEERGKWAKELQGHLQRARAINDDGGSE
ncbi:MAG: hypothetical protein U0174_18645 [Polyangiaceae bacterium]